MAYLHFLYIYLHLFFQNEIAKKEKIGTNNKPKIASPLLITQIT